MEKSEFLKVATLNVKNVESNTVYISEMLKKHDILAIQEHWLFNFQLQDLEKTFCSHFVHSKAVDDYNPLPPTQKPRGYGGVALFYSKDLNYTVKKLTTGCSRIVAVEVLTTPPLCI